jgi:hypothetical protein
MNPFDYEFLTPFFKIHSQPFFFFLRKFFLPETVETEIFVVLRVENLWSRHSITGQASKFLLSRMSEMNRNTWESVTMVNYPTTVETEAGGSQVLGQPGQHSETPSQKEKVNCCKC